MLIITRTRLTFLTLLMVLIAVPFSSAQKSPNPPAAPVPAQILSAKRVFISNGGSSVESAPDVIPPNLPYDEFYAGMQAWGRYKLVPSFQSDLVFEIRFVTVSPTIFSKDGSRTKRQVELLIIDPTSHITLWTIYEQFDGAFLDSNKRKDLDTGIAALLSDLKKLTAPPVPAEPAKPVDPQKSGRSIW